MNELFSDFLARPLTTVLLCSTKKMFNARYRRKTEKNIEKKDIEERQRRIEKKDIEEQKKDIEEQRRKT